MAQMKVKKVSPIYPLVLLLVLFISLGGVFYFFNNYNFTLDKLAVMTSERDQLLLDTTSSNFLLSEASTTIAAMQEQLSLTNGELKELSDNYSHEKQKNDDFEDEYREVINTVKDLDKLSKTDKELLQKYSKVYFLNEHFIPESLKEVPDEWKYTENKTNQLHNKVMPFFEDMLEASKEDGIDLWVVSAYRSFSTQAQLKGAYTVTYGSGANAFSADQGFSEHQLGTTIDFTTTGLGGGLEGFGNTPAFAWLQDNAHKYGFTLSYPAGNAYYVYEPWHWRFVGTELARDLDRKNQTFYDLDQRDINAYLLNIFD